MHINNASHAPQALSLTICELNSVSHVPRIASPAIEWTAAFSVRTALVSTRKTEMQIYATSAHQISIWLENNARIADVTVQNA